MQPTQPISQPQPSAPAAPDAAARVARGSASRAGGFEASCFAAHDPVELIERLVDGDPLELRAAIDTRLRERALLADAGRVHLRALALLARGGTAREAREDPRAWIEACVDRAIEDALADCLQVATGARPPELPSLSALGRPLGIELRRACALLACFASRPLAERRAFVGLVLEGGALDELAHATGVSASEIGRRARRTLDALLRASLACAPSAEAAR